MEQKEWTHRFLKVAPFVPPLIMLFLGTNSVALLASCFCLVVLLLLRKKGEKSVKST